MQPSSSSRSDQPREGPGRCGHALCQMRPGEAGGGTAPPAKRILQPPIPPRLALRRRDVWMGKWDLLHECLRVLERHAAACLAPGVECPGIAGLPGGDVGAELERLTWVEHLADRLEMCL